MSKTQKCFRNLSLLLLSVFMLAGCETQKPSSSDGRYFTWVDEQGRVRRSPIPEDQNPIEARAKKIQAQHQAMAGADGRADQSADSQVTTASKRETTEPRLTGKAATRHDSVARDGSQAKPDNAVTEPPGSDRENRQSPAPVISAPAEEQPEQAGISRHQRPTRKAQKARDESTDSQYNLKHYPDGNKLAAKGFVRDGEPLPYFTWRDSQGHMRVSQYRPKGKSAQSRPVTKNTPQLTAALVLNGRRPKTPGKMAPDVMSVMGLKKTSTILQEWNADCCQNLPVRDSEQWDSSREFQVDMPSDARRFAFSTGKSVYQLIRLPSGEEATSFVMRLRSYIHHGVFVPTLAFLDDQLRTRRLVTDLAFSFNPETWHSLGSFQAMVPVFPAKGERWLLVMSRKQDQEGQTLVEKDGWPTAIPHQAHGTLGMLEVE